MCGDPRTGVSCSGGGERDIIRPELNTGMKSQLRSTSKAAVITLVLAFCASPEKIQEKLFLVGVSSEFIDSLPLVPPVPGLSAASVLSKVHDSPSDWIGYWYSGEGGHLEHLDSAC